MGISLSNFGMTVEKYREVTKLSSVFKDKIYSNIWRPGPHIYYYSS